MKFDAILEYQKIDVELVKVERELSKSKEKALVNDLKNKINIAGNNVTKLNLEADELQLNADKIAQSIEKYENEIKEISSHIGEVADLVEVEYYEKMLKNLSDDFDKLLREIQQVSSRMDYVKDNNDKVINQAVSLKEQYNVAYKTYQEFKRNLQVKALPTAEKLKKLEKEIQPNILALYKKLRDNRKLPAFVEYEGDGMCFCGMNLPNSSISKLKEEGDYVECPNCGRIVVVNK